MSINQPHDDPTNYARRGDAIYDRDLRPSLEREHLGKFVAIDIETGAFEVDASELVASDRLLARVPNAQTWLRRVCSRYARRIGGHDRAMIG